MFGGLRRLGGELAELRRFKAGSGSPRIVFYAEDHGAWPHFAPIVAELTGRLDREIAYVTSSAADPVLGKSDPKSSAYGIGAGAARIAFFESLRECLVVMTMPDLESFHIKRSKLPGVHYAYVHHSMVSTHMIYRPGAFDHFDTIFCTGPHHIAETRANEKIHGLRAKQLVEHGYGRLEAILERARAAGPANRRVPRILLAPSWGDQAILETVGVRTVQALLDEGLHVTVRPHPRTRQKSPRTIDDLGRRFGGHDRFELDENAASFDTLLDADLMVSDWSGAALEYAFGVGRPVLFLDVPRKVNNPRYAELAIEPVEVRLRRDLGVVVAPDDLTAIRREAVALIARPGEYAARLRELRARHVFNVGRSGAVAADALAQLFDGAFGGR